MEMVTAGTDLSRGSQQIKSLHNSPRVSKLKHASAAVAAAATATAVATTYLRLMSPSAPVDIRQQSSSVKCNYMDSRTNLSGGS